MKRKITLSMMLILSLVLITMMSSDLTAQMQRNRVFLADTGVITLGPNQSATMSVAAGDINGDDMPDIITQKMTYSQGVCNSQEVCKLTLDKLQTSNVSLSSGEAITTGISQSAAGVRFRVLTRRNNVKVNLSIVDNTTGEVQSLVIELENVLISS